MPRSPQRARRSRTAERSRRPPPLSPTAGASRPWCRMVLARNSKRSCPRGEIPCAADRTLADAEKRPTSVICSVSHPKSMQSGTPYRGRAGNDAARSRCADSFGCALWRLWEHSSVAPVASPPRSSPARPRSRSRSRGPHMRHERAGARDHSNANASGAAWGARTVMTPISAGGGDRKADSHRRRTVVVSAR